MHAYQPAIVLIEHNTSASDIKPILQHIARDAGNQAEVITVSGTGSVLAEIARRPVPLLIVDDGVPTDAVLLFAQELREASPHTRIVQVLSERPEALERRAAAAGVGLLPNPFPYAALEQLVREVLEA